jgi:hypothetical protein
MSRRLKLSVLVGVLTFGMVLAQASAASALTRPSATTTVAAASTAKAPTKVTARPDSVSAQLAARVTGHRVEDTSQGDQFTHVYANPDGTWTADTSTDPVQVRDGSGHWHAVDTTLKATPSGRLSPASSTTDVSFSAGGDTTAATMTIDGHLLTWDWPTVLPAPSVEGATARYPISDGEELVLSASATGFSEDLMLTQRPVSPASVVLPLSANGAAVTVSSTGGIEVSTARGKRLVTAPRPFAYDSSSNAGGDPQVGAIAAQVVAGAGASARGLELKPDWGFLSNPKTVYPVTLDPSFTTYTSGDTWVQTPDYPTA